MIKYEHLVTYSEQTHFQKAINSYGERGWKLCAAFPEQNVYRLIFVKEIPIELSTDIEQNLFRVLKEWSCDYDGNSDEVAVSKMQKIAEEFAIKYSWWKSAIRTENHKTSPQYFIIEGEGLQKTVELKPDRDLLIIYKEFLKNEK